MARLYLIQGKFEQAEEWARKLVESGEGGPTGDKLLQAARDKKVSEGLRLIIDPK